MSTTPRFIAGFSVMHLRWNTAALVLAPASRFWLMASRSNLREGQRTLGLSVPRRRQLRLHHYLYLSSRRNTKAAYRFMGKLLNNTEHLQIQPLINTDKAPTYGRALALLKREGKCPQHVQHRQIKYRNNIIECDHGKLKRIINATLGFKSMKTAYATIKGIEVMRALRKGQAESFYFGHPWARCVW